MLLYPVKMTLGQRIKAARERLQPKPTQRDIGDAFGISDKAVSAWERDDTMPELEKIPKLAKRLKVPLNWLLSGTGPPPPEDDIQVRLEALSPDEREMLGAMIDALRTRGRPAA